MIDMRVGPDAKLRQAVERGNWDTAVRELRRMLADAGPAASPELRQGLATCLANRAAKRAERGLASLKPDDATRKRLAADQALHFFYPDRHPAPAEVLSAPPRPPWWRRIRMERPHLSWRGLLYWIIYFTPVWLGLLAWGADTVRNGALRALLITVMFVYLLTALAFVLRAWLAGRAEKRSRGFVAASRESSADRCDVEGCREPAQYQIRLDKIISESLGIANPFAADMGTAAGRFGLKHLCSAHAAAFEDAMNRPIVSPDAIKLLLKARTDLEEAAELAPGQRAIKDNLRQVRKILARLGVRKTASMVSGPHR